MRKTLDLPQALRANNLRETDKTDAILTCEKAVSEFLIENSSRLFVRPKGASYSVTSSPFMGSTNLALQAALP
jgi:hypothetical protein